MFTIQVVVDCLLRLALQHCSEAVARCAKWSIREPRGHSLKQELSYGSAAATSQHGASPKLSSSMSRFRGKLCSIAVEMAHKLHAMYSLIA